MKSKRQKLVEDIAKTLKEIEQRRRVWVNNQLARMKLGLPLQEDK